MLKKMKKRIRRYLRDKMIDLLEDCLSEYATFSDLDGEFVKFSDLDSKNSHCDLDEIECRIEDIDREMNCRVDDIERIESDIENRFDDFENKLDIAIDEFRNYDLDELIEKVRDLEGKLETIRKHLRIGTLSDNTNVENVSSTVS